MRGVAAILGGVAVIGVIGVAVFTLDPFLEPEDVYLEGKLRFLSNPARAGYNAYAAHCAGCHGILGEGTDTAPSLSDSATARRFYDRRELHRALAEAIAAHESALPGGRADGTLDFNEVEMLGKFLREFARRERELAG